jgi:hypothetical protein
MPPDKGGMARSLAILVLAVIMTPALPETVIPQTEPAQTETGQPSDTDPETDPTPLSKEQQNLVDTAVGRFDAQGLELPAVEFVFHPDLRPCHGHKGMFHRSTRTLEMCSMDISTMLHELAHAWANESLPVPAREDFVRSRGLDSWNDHDDAWDRRGTEHVAETIAWALAEDSTHVKWVETLSDGSTLTTHRILTIGVNVDTLVDNFEDITGMKPIFRHASEWEVEETTPITTPLELRRLGG